jgi:hypothetical protein
MTTNLRKNLTDGSLTWRFDLDTIEELFADYGRHDLWPALSLPTTTDSDVHLVRATQNGMWREAAVVASLEAAVEGNGGRLHTHDVDAGHWLHAEKPGEVFELMQDNGVRDLLG